MEVYIVLTDTGSWLTKLIKCFTRRPLNHASISFTKDLKETYSFGRKHPNNPLVGGFVQEDLNGKLFRNATCAIYRYRVSPTEFRKMHQCLKQIENHKQEYRYNFIGLFGVMFNKEIRRKNAFFCSQFVATILQKGGISLKNKPAGLVEPSDFAENEATQLVYAGQLRTYLLKQQTIIPQIHMYRKESFFERNHRTILNSLPHRRVKSAS
ncbi:hypothetical protein [Bacillus marasmi]|uniref:hypothetical protein n=1 Tax=Bacillus marasmi TaxID=1926279 RepID=UPI00164DA3BD|nr:hypothetical protein [Bacillus marasmi]